MDDDTLPVIDLGPEVMILRGFTPNGNPIMDVLQADGSYKTCHTEVVEQFRIEGPVTFGFSPDGTAWISPADEDDGSDV